MVSVPKAPAKAEPAPKQATTPAYATPGDEMAPTAVANLERLKTRSRRGK